MKNKVCIKCGENKNVSDFPSGRNQCKECWKEYQKKYQKKYREENKEGRKEYDKKYREENKERIKEKSKKYYEENKDTILGYRKKWRENNKEKVAKINKKYYEGNKQKIKERNKEYYKKWRQENKEYFNEYVKNKRKTDPLFRLRENIKNSIRCGIKSVNGFKNKRTEEILGCSFEDFKKHIESQWEDWMNWDNYGLYNGEECYGWDCDHIIPLSSCECEDDIYRLNHYSNLQPLCSYINRDVKRGNLDWEL